MSAEAPYDPRTAEEVRGLNVGATRIDGEPWVLVAVRTMRGTVTYRIPIDGAATLEQAIGEARRKVGRLVIARGMPNGQRRPG